VSKYEGNCFICGKTAGRTALKNHLLKEHNNGSEGCYLIRAESVYRGSPFWLFFTASKTALLEDVDRFLRAIWLECCGHLSEFTDGYEDDGYPMTTRLSKFEVGATLPYLYDFGSTTELLVTLWGETLRPKQGPRVIQLLARNTPVETPCLACKKPASYVDVASYDEGKAFCDSCYEKNDCDDDHYLLITNSPRSGECAYAGFGDKWTFDPSSEFPLF